MKKCHYLTTLALLLALLSCQNESNKPVSSTSPVKVKVMQASSSATSESRHFSGTVEESSTTSLSFPVMGTVKKIYVDLGERVTQGELIAEIDPTSIRSSYDAAKSTLEQAEDAYKRMKLLHDKGSIAEMKWIEVQSKLQQARSMEEVARKNLKDCKLYAPYNGVISEKNIEAGQNVMPGVPVAQLVGVQDLKVKISVPETEIANIQKNQKAKIMISALGNSSFEGVVAEKGIVANTLSRSYDVKIHIDHPSKDIMPGMVTEVVLATSDENNYYILPAHVIQLDENNQNFVWVAIDGKATKRTIQCGKFTSNGIIVLSGINEGDLIITEGQQKVCENTPVTIK